MRYAVTVEELETEIRSAVATAKQQGWTIRPGDFIRGHTMRCCPLGALDVAAGESVYSKLPHDVVEAFYDGFDSNTKVCGNSDFDSSNPFYALGQQFRKELL